MPLKTILIILFLTLTAFNVLADGIPIEPGKWEITSTVTMAMLP